MHNLTKAGALTSESIRILGRNSLHAWLAASILLTSIASSGCAARRPPPVAKSDHGTRERFAAAIDTTRHDLNSVELASTPALPMESTPAPFVIRDAMPTMWAVSLSDLRGIALEHNPILRDLGGQVLQSPASVTTLFDQQILAQDPQFGVPAALSAFDRSYGLQFFYDRTDRAFNNQTVGGGAFELQQDLLTAQARTGRRTLDGSEWVLQNTTLYDDNNRLGNLFPSTWENVTEASVRKPLLRGAGVPFNSIAGPNANPGFRFSNGIVIARLNEQISATDFEIALSKYLRQVEVSYWQLYVAIHEWESRRSALAAAKQTYAIVRARFESNLNGSEADKEAQVRYQCLLYEELVSESLNGSDRLVGVFEAERKLRRLLGLPPTDGRLMWPIDQPPQAPVQYEWTKLVDCALQRRPELRKQSLRLHQQQLQLVAARNFLLPRVDLVGAYRLRGFGDDLTGGGPRFASALQDQGTLDHQEWRAGMEMDLPSGFRQGHAAVQYARLQLCREQAIFEAQQQQVTHELSDAVGRVKQQCEALQWTLARVQAAEQRLQATQAQFEINQTSVDLLLEAQEQLFESQRMYHSMRANYAQSLTQVDLSTGAYLQQLGITLQ